MQLFYCKGALRNVGDDLNPWLFGELGSDLLDDDPSSLLIGVGTILDSRIPSEPSKYVFGTGVRIPKSVEPDSTWQILAVRGPLSAQVLNIDSSCAVTDPALLASRLFRQQSGLPVRKVMYVPYFRSALSPEWKVICEDLGIHYLDPRSAVETFLNEISTAEVVVTEAMHGAILADSFRRPWVAVQAFSQQHEGPLNTFKWTDWCQSVGLEFSPYSLPVIWPPGKGNSRWARGKRWLKTRQVRRELGILINKMRPILSSNSTFAFKCELLLDRFAALRARYGKHGT
jgi:succinoglycan biosynthesis protein ExoV